MAPSPPSNRVRYGPSTGACPAICVVTTVPQYARLSHGSRYPVSPYARVTSSSTTPTIQVASRGFLYAPYRKTCTMCSTCLLYTSDAADDLLCVDLGGRRI